MPCIPPKMDTLQVLVTDFKSEADDRAKNRSLIA
jgi:hypothetical protein